jgi:hypothetical protein
MTQDRVDVRENGKIKTKQLVYNFDQNNGKKENRNGIGQKCIALFAQRPEANNAELCIVFFADSDYTDVPALY